MNANKLNDIAIALEFKIDTLQANEKITKDLLSGLSRDILDYVSQSKDVQITNRLLSVLTPMNRKTAILYFKSFLPFVSVTNDAGEFERFGKMTKKTADQKFELITEFLVDPHNNIWSWAERNVVVEPKEYDVKKVTKAIETGIKKVGQVDVIKACFAGGIDIETLLQVLGEMAAQQENDEQQQEDDEQQQEENA